MLRGPVIQEREYSRTSMARTRWVHENMFETGVVRANKLIIAPGQEA